MAKAIAYCTCAECGETVIRTKICRNRSMADGWAEYMESSNDILCDDCYAKRCTERSIKEASEDGAVIKEVHYGVYKDNEDVWKAIYGTYNSETKTIQVRAIKRTEKEHILRLMGFMRPIIAEETEKMTESEAADFKAQCKTWARETVKSYIQYAYTCATSEEVKAWIRQEWKKSRGIEESEEEPEKEEKTAREPAEPAEPEKPVECREVTISYADYKGKYGKYEKVKGTFNGWSYTVNIMLPVDVEYEPGYVNVEMPIEDYVTKYSQYYCVEKKHRFFGDEAIVSLPVDVPYEKGEYTKVRMPYKTYKSDYSRYYANHYSSSDKSITVWLPEGVEYTETREDKKTQEKAKFHSGAVDEIEIVPEKIDADALVVEIPEELKNGVAV